MKTTNKLTLKALHEELENIKASKLVKTSGSLAKNKKVEGNPIVLPAVGGDNLPNGGNTNAKGGIGHDIKNSYINNLYMKSSAFALYLITGILGYAHKIPFIRKILIVLTAWYGRSTWWQIISKILRISRKTLVLINAAIGVYVVFATIGFSFDNLLVGFTALGAEYIRIMSNLVKRLFNWFVELFDYKLIPNVPSNPPSKPYFPN